MDKCNLEAEINRLNIATKGLKLAGSKPIGRLLWMGEPNAYSCKGSNVRRRTAYEHNLLAPQTPPPSQRGTTTLRAAPT